MGTTRPEILGSRILLVDDEPRNLVILEELLEGFVLETATGGAEALDKVTSFRPDLILLDVMMPEVNGYEVCRNVRDHPDFRFVKIIFVSGKASTQERLRGYDEGADDYVTKPFDHDELLAKVHVFLRLKQAEQINQLKTDFLTLIQHETRTPLTGIIGLTDLILEDPNMSMNQVRESCLEVQTCGRTLHEFLDKVVLLCHLKATDDIDRKPAAVLRAVDSAMVSLKEEASAQRVRFEVDLTEKTLPCDVELLERSIRVVLQNAIQHSPEGGVIAVKGQDRGDSYTLSISDEGCGMAPERRDEVFTEFSVNDVAHHSAGQGLSLAIARRILQLHCGSLTLEDAPAEGGATFVFRVPSGMPVTL